jgi:hypothetical protein
MSKAPVYLIYRSMLSRCNDRRQKAYPYYGGRGIKVCPEWNCFENFYRDMGDRPPGLSLDRIDNDKGYSKENCRWATTSQQRANQRPRLRIEQFSDKVLIMELKRRNFVRVDGTDYPAGFGFDFDTTAPNIRCFKNFDFVKLAYLPISVSG